MGDLEAFNQNKEGSLRRKAWVIFFLLAFLMHLILLQVHLPSFSTLQKPPPLQVEHYDAKKLDELKRKWSQKKGLLIQPKDADTPPPEEKTENDKARYESDRTRSVEKEQKAKDAAVVPRPNLQGSQKSQENTKRQEKPKEQSQNNKSNQRSVPLGQLGLPLAGYKSKPEQERKPSSPSRSEQQLQQLGGQQALMDPTLPEGSDNVLNTQESKYYSFYSRVYYKVGPIWESLVRGIASQGRIQPGNYQTTADVVLDTDGNVRRVEIISRSGVEELDQAAIDCWMRAKTFQNPPAALADSRGEIHLGWTYHFQMSDSFLR